MPPAFSIRAMSSPFAGYTEAIVRLFRQSPSLYAAHLRVTIQEHEGSFTVYAHKHERQNSKRHRFSDIFFLPREQTGQPACYIYRTN